MPGPTICQPQAFNYRNTRLSPKASNLIDKYPRMSGDNTRVTQHEDVLNIRVKYQHTQLKSSDVLYSRCLIVIETRATGRQKYKCKRKNKRS